jgi:hypothetical protein
MAEKDKVGFLALQIELAQQNIATWPKWLQEATGVEGSDSDDEGAATTQPQPPLSADASE